MASKEELLASINPDIKLTKNLFKRIYAYNMSNPSFADEAITALENAGCSKARKYYDDWVEEYEADHEREMKEIAKWYRKEYEKRWKQKLKEGESNGTTIRDWHRFKGFPPI